MIDGTIWLGFAASLVAGLSTGAGALPVLFTKKVSDKLLDVMLGFSAGVMLAACLRMVGEGWLQGEACSSYRD